MRAGSPSTGAAVDAIKSRGPNPKGVCLEHPERGSEPRDDGVRCSRERWPEPEKNAGETFLIRRAEVILGTSLQAVPAPARFLDHTSPGAHGGESDVEAERGAAKADERPG